MVAAEATDDAGGATKKALAGSRTSTVARAASSILWIVEIMISGVCFLLSKLLLSSCWWKRLSRCTLVCDCVVQGGEVETLCIGEEKEKYVSVCAHAGGGYLLMAGG